MNAVRVLLASASIIAASLASFGCAKPECANVRYTDPECRVVVENELARLRTSTGVEVRFQEPDATDDDTWVALGLLDEVSSGLVTARVAGPGSFALSVRRALGDVDALQLRLENVDPRATVVVVAPDSTRTPVPAPDDGATWREIDLQIPPTRTVWVRGSTECPERFRLAMTADIQTNPTQFERILEQIQLEAHTSSLLGEPLVGLIIAGDLTESSRAEEFDTIASILERAPIPVAVTAGNHDTFRPLHPYYNHTFGPGNYAFSVCEARVTLLDSGSGSLAESIMGRLPELLDRRGQRFSIAALHHPPHPRLTGAGWSQEDQAQRFLVEAAIAGVDVILAGHYHALRQFEDISVGGRNLRQIIAGTGGAYQGLGVPRYGYLRLTFGDSLEVCFVEVPASGLPGPEGGPVDGIPYCPD